MLYDVIPAKEITGGPWYSDQEFDHEFVGELGNFIVQVVKNIGMADLNTILEKVRISGISKVRRVFLFLSHYKLYTEIGRIIT